MVIRSAAEGAAALRLAPAGLLLLSAEGAAAALGARGWRALVARAAADAPGATFADALCCGDAPGLALDALRAGCRVLILEGRHAAFPAVAGAAAEAGATLLPVRPPALDLRGFDLTKPYGAARLAQWLTAHPDDSAPASG